MILKKGTNLKPYVCFFGTTVFVYIITKLNGVVFFLENVGELHFIILRRKWDKNPVTTHTTNATLNSYSRAV